MLFVDWFIQLGVMRDTAKSCPADAEFPFRREGLVKQTNKQQTICGAQLHSS